MNKLYFRLRIFLLTLAFGMAFVPFSNAVYQKWTTIPVDLPQVESSRVINVFVPPKPTRQLCTWGHEGYCYCSPHSLGIKGSCAAVNEYWRQKDIEDEKNGVF